ncbi:MAG: aldehyde dehydrogenase [Planctomycetes bacterium]|jgi:succinate-semialdehyde dehydrogenase/glutarate-semialdehyde dehydrogenase|nr:aldehyde dehydrogenase [Planctomycetota bacterium]
MPETTDRADRETPADIPPTLPEGLSRDAIKARETRLRESGRQKTAENLQADDAATREVPMLKEEWRERAAAAARSISGDEPVETIEAVHSAPTEYVPPPAPSAPTKSSATVYELPVDDTAGQTVRDAMDAARGAQPAWRALRFEQRVPYLDALRQELVDQRNDHAPALATLSGRPMVELLAGEYMPVLEQLRSLPITAPPLMVERNAELSNPLYPDVSMRLSPQPHGVIVAGVAFGPVFGQCMNLAIDAIATGNAAIIVCDEERPRIAEIMERIFERARLPKGLVRIVTGGPRLMQAFIDRRPDKFFYRGYADHAAMLAQLCVMRGIEFSLGVSTKDILAVLETADPAEAARAACWTTFAGGGITGGSTERIVVASRIYDEFRVAFVDAVRTMNSHHAQLADIRNTLDDKRVKEMLVDAIAQGGRVTHPAGENPGKWILWRPAIVEGLPLHARLSKEQALAPICVLYRAEDVAYELRRMVGAAPAATLNVIGTPRKGEWDEIMALNVGTITLNEPTIGPSAWMGSGPSGNLVNHSHCGPQHMLRVRQIVENDYGEIGRVGYFPYTDDKAHALMDAMPAFYDTKPFLRAKQRFALMFRTDLRRLIERGV